MTTDQGIRRVVLAVEHAELETGACAYCSGLIPQSEIDVKPLNEFARLLDGKPEPGELRVLMLHADEEGKLQPGSPIVQSIISTRSPVLVARKSRGGSMPEPQVNRIVVPLDGTAVAGQAIPMASRVARNLNVPVRFVMVIDPARVIPPAYAYDPEAWGMIEELRQTSHWALSQAEASMRNDGVDVSSELLLGSVHESLSKSIGNGDLVVMTTHGPGPAGSRTRESVALQTLIAVPQPILIVRAEEEDPFVVDAYQAGGAVSPQRDESGRMD